MLIDVMYFVQDRIDISGLADTNHTPARMSLLLAEILKNRTHSIPCLKSSQFEKVTQLMISKFCCNEKSSSVMKIIS